MKTKLLLFFITFFTISSVLSQRIYVPDDKFEQALIALGLDDVMDNYVTKANLTNTALLKIQNYGIKDLTGIKEFPSLQVLQVSGNELETIDVRNMQSSRVALTCDNNLITSILFDEKLESLSCSNNKITSLDFQNSNLQSLNAKNNNLTFLNLKNGLNNRITNSEFDVTGNSNLVCIEVDNYDYSTDNWTKLDSTSSFSENCSKFDYTFVPDDNFEQILINQGYDDVLDDYVLTENIKSVINLTLGAVDVADLTGIRGFESLSYLDCKENTLTQLDVSKNKNLVTLICYNNQLNELILVDSLQSIYCYDNNLSNIDTSTLTNLKEFQCYNNLLNNLDLNNNTELKNLECGNNPLSELDVTKNINLEGVFCYKSNVESLDLTKNIKLTKIVVEENDNLSELLINNGNNVNVTQFLSSQNPKLTCIQVDEVNFAETNFTDIDPQVNFSTNCEAIPFITKWQVSGTQIITIPVFDSETYNYTVDWGDGDIENNITENAVHQYSSIGEYEVKISGNFPRIYFNESEDKSKIIDILQWGNNPWSSMNSAFKGCDNLTITATDSPNLFNVTDMSSMFESCTALNSNINHWDVSNISNMQNLFSFCKAFNQPLENWDVSNVTSMQNMFYVAEEFNQPLNDWNVSSVNTFASMFQQCRKFNQPLDKWDLSNANNISHMFYLNRVFNQNINVWNVSNVTDMTGVFSNASGFNQPLNDWDVGKVNSMESLFSNASLFNQPLDKWNTAKVTSMYSMFWETSFNQEINMWNVGNVTNMYWMFRNATFNKPLNNWNVGNVTNMEGMFSGNDNFNQPLDNWDVSSVINMASMFDNADNFNQPLNNWDVSNVRKMSGMFASTKVFNQPLDKWNVSNVTNMIGMFNFSSMFNQSLEKWDVSNVTSMTNMFNSTSISTENYDLTLNGWNSLPSLSNNVSISFGNATYCEGEEARNNIINAYNWTITDGGIDCFVNTPPTTSSVTFSGTLTEGEELTASYEYSDFDADVESGSTYKWYVSEDAAGTNKVAITDATSQTYTLTTVDVGKYISFEVTPNDGTEFGESLESELQGPVEQIFVNTAPTVSSVTFTGTLTEAEILTASYEYSDVDADVESGSTYKWYISEDAAGTNKTAITDATSQTYTLTTEDIGKFISFEVTPNDGTEFGESVESELQGPIEAIWVNTAPTVTNVQISGTLTEAELLTASYEYSDVDADVESGSTYKWYVSDDAAGTNKVAISDATSQTYTLTTEDIGKFISFEVTPNDGTEFGESVESELQGPIEAIWVNTAPTVTNVQISGTLTEAEELTASYEYSDVDADVESGSTYKWYISEDAAGTNKTVITDAISQTYTLTTEDVGKYISFEVTPNDGTEFGESVESELQGLIEAIWVNTAPTVTNVQISGTLTEAELLIASYEYSDFDADVESGSTYKWYVSEDAAGTNKVAITDAISQSYTLATEDIGKYISFEVTPNDGTEFGESVESELQGPIEAIFVNTAPTASSVSFFGTLIEAELLTASYEYSDVDADVESGSTYKWYISEDAAGTNKTAITDATSQTYTLTTEDIGKYISFEVTPNDGTEFGESLESELQGPIEALAVVLIPDVNFEQALIDLGFDTNGLNGNILEKEAQDIQILNIGNPGNNSLIPNVTEKIKNISGIESMINLSKIDLSYHEISKIDLAQNDNLTEINLSFNLTLQAIDVSENINLESLFLSNTNLSSLDVSLLTNLKRLYVYDNQLTELSLSNNELLEELSAYNNQLKSIKLEVHKNLNLLDVSNNQLTGINLTNLESLEVLVLQNNSIINIDINNNKKLERLDLKNNLLERAYLKNEANSIISIFDIRENSDLVCITVDDVTYSNTNWTKKDNQSNYNTDCSAEWEVFTEDANFNNAIVSISGIDSDGDGVVTYEEAQAFTGDLDLSGLNISDITGLEAFNNAASINISGNVITDISNLLNANTVIVSSRTTGEKRTVKRKTTSLQKLNVANNLINQIDLSEVSSLTELNVSNNKLTYLNLNNNSNTSLIKVDATENSELTCIQVDSVDDADNNADWVKDDIASYNRFCPKPVLNTENYLTESISMYPNPATSNIQITITNDITLRTVEIYNSIGKKVIESNKSLVEVKSLANGIYFVRVITDKGFINKKLIKK